MDDPNWRLVLLRKILTALVLMCMSCVFASCSIKTEYLLPIASGDWQQIDREPYQNRSTAVFWEDGGVDIIVSGRNLGKGNNKEKPELYFVLYDEHGGTRVDPRGVVAISPCNTLNGPVTDLVSVISFREVDEPYFPRFPRRDLIEVQKNPAMGPKQSVNFFISFDLDPTTIKSCTIRFADAVETANGVSPPDLFVVRGVLKQDLVLNY